METTFIVILSLIVIGFIIVLIRSVDLGFSTHEYRIRQTSNGKFIVEKQLILFFIKWWSHCFADPYDEDGDAYYHQTYLEAKSDLDKMLQNKKEARVIEKITTTPL